MGKTIVVSLCDKCKCCPTVQRKGDEFVITDDNEPGRLREVRLNKGQFRALLQEGHRLLDET